MLGLWPGVVGRMAFTSVALELVLVLVVWECIPLGLDITTPSLLSSTRVSPWAMHFLHIMFCFFPIKCLPSDSNTAWLNTITTKNIQQYKEYWIFGAINKADIWKRLAWDGGLETERQREEWIIEHTLPGNQCEVFKPLASPHHERNSVHTTAWCNRKTILIWEAVEYLNLPFTRTLIWFGF